MQYYTYEGSFWREPGPEDDSAYAYDRWHHVEKRWLPVDDVTSFPSEGEMDHWRELGEAEVVQLLGLGRRRLDLRGRSPATSPVQYPAASGVGVSVLLRQTTSRAICS